MAYHPTMRTLRIEYTDSINATYTIEFTATHRDALFICQEFILRHGVNGRTVEVTIRNGWTGEFDVNDLMTHEFSDHLGETWNKAI